MTCLCGKGGVHWCVRMAHQLTFVARMGLFDEKCMQVNKNPTDSHLQWGWGLLVFKNSLLTYVWVCFFEKCMQINKNPTDSCLQWGWGLLLWYLVWVVLKDECYVEFLPEHSLMFSDVLHSHMTPFHPFCPTCPFKILMPSGFCSISTTFLCQHHIHHINHGRIMPGLSWNHLGIFRAVTEHHQKHRGYT